MHGRSGAPGGCGRALARRELGQKLWLRNRPPAAPFPPSLLGWTAFVRGQASSRTWNNAVKLLRPGVKSGSSWHAD